MKNCNNQYTNDCLYVCKVFALISIITAHTEMNISDGLLLLLKQRFAAIGVIVFIIMSGYFYEGKKYGGFKRMLQHKGITVCIPWFVFGSISYIWGQIHGITIPEIDLAEMLCFILGYKSYLYYLTILLLCFVFFYNTNKYVLYLAVIINAISLFMTSYGLLDSVIHYLGITHYLNIFNWCGFFSFGIICRNKNYMNRAISWIRNNQWKSIITICLYPLIVIITAIVIENDAAGYFSKTGAILELYGAAVVLIISSQKSFHRKMVFKIAAYSFTIYLTHTMILSLLMYLPVLNWQASILLPLVIIFVGTFACEVVMKVGDVLNIKKTVGIILGIRDIRQ